MRKEIQEILHAWILLTLTFSCILASLALIRGLAGLLAGRGFLARLEALLLTLTGLAGWFGALLIRFPRL
jgi:hypothetical protein